MKGIKVIAIIREFFENQRNPINERQARNYAQELSLRDTNIKIFRSRSDREGWRVRMLYAQGWINKIEKIRAQKAKDAAYRATMRKLQEERERMQKECERERKEYMEKILRATKVRTWDEMTRLQNKFIETYTLDSIETLKLSCGLIDYESDDPSDIGHQFVKFIEEDRETIDKRHLSPT
jgi:hypothetical protein